MAPLYRRHERALRVLFTDIENHAAALDQIFVGTAGSVNVRRNAQGFEFYSHQYYDGTGKQRERYVGGPVGDRDADGLADELRARIAEQRELVRSVRVLGREGYHLVERRTYSTLASLARHRLFDAGAVLIGSHAYGTLLNLLGARAASYATEDIDIARPRPLAFETPLEAAMLEILRESGIAFVEVPGFGRAAATSFKQRGRSRFHVDLLAPSRDESFPTLPAPELGAHALGLPFLGFLLAETQPGTVLSRTGAIRVRVPLPERLAIHKLIASRLRSGRSEKSLRDQHQAAILLAVVGDLHPGAIEDALADVPVSARQHLANGIAMIREELESAAPAAWSELSSLASG